MRSKKRQLPPAVAFLFLTVSTAVLVYSLRDQLGPSAVTVAGQPTEFLGEVPASGDLGQAGAVGGGFTDLLAEFGSYDRQTPVRPAFCSFVGAESELAMPAGETVAAAIGWVGADPPELRLGVVMVSRDARRAVLGGQVVGVGDEVGGVRIRGIDDDHVVGTWGARTLTYDLLDGWPREFRPELERRTFAASVEPAGRGSADGAETPIEELNQMLRAQKEK